MRIRIALLMTSNGVAVDVAFGAIPFEDRLMKRATDWVIPDHGTTKTCSGNNVIALKAFAARDQDSIDIRGVLIRQRRRINREVIFHELTPLVEMKEDPEILDQLIQLFQVVKLI